MTDKLIERIKADREANLTCVSAEYTQEMEARILVDEKIIKAAEKLARVASQCAGYTQQEHDRLHAFVAAYRAAVAEGRG